MSVGKCKIFKPFIIVSNKWMASLLYPRQPLVWPQQMWRLLAEHLQHKYECFIIKINALKNLNAC
jgi:hypothetical protein